MFYLASCIIDTNILLDNVDLSEYEKIYVPIVVLEEIDNLKESKDYFKSYKARVAIREIIALENKIEYVFKKNELDFDFYSSDNSIIMQASYVQNEIDKNAIMLSHDLNVIEKCKTFKILVKELKDYKKNEVYKGYKKVFLNDIDLAYFYEHINKNIYDLLPNQYLIIYDKDKNFISNVKWNGSTHVDLTRKTIKNDYIGQVKAFDEIQQCAVDSLWNDTITCLFGRAGSGKSHLSLHFSLGQLKNGKINKLYALATCVDLKGANQIGFVPGTKEEKLLNSNLGNILASKLGDITIVERLVASEQLILVPLNSIRGMEIGENDILYVTEAQNLNIYQMKNILQRCKGKVILEGDFIQADAYDGYDNGMLRMIEVFKGDKSFSCIKLKTNYRHRIGELADSM